MCKSIAVVVFTLSMIVAGCGGDDDTAAGVSDSCTMGMKSVPQSVGDPCPQTGTDCAKAGMIAVATCAPDGHWTKNATAATVCDCVASGAAGAAGGAMTSMAKTCGNGAIDTAGGEQCDGAMLNGATCDKLKPGSTGMVTCGADCRYVMTMCASSTMGMGGTGGTP